MPLRYEGIEFNGVTPQRNIGFSLIAQDACMVLIIFLFYSSDLFGSVFIPGVTEREGSHNDCFEGVLVLLLIIWYYHTLIFALRIS